MTAPARSRPVGAGARGHAAVMPARHRPLLLGLASFAVTSAAILGHAALGGHAPFA